MKRLLASLCMLLCFTAMYAQHEEPAEPLPQTKSFGGFLLDMTLMNLQMPPRLTDFKLTVPDAGKDFLNKDYSEMFRLKPTVVYAPELPGAFSPGGQGATFLLNNGLRIRLTGQYDRQGRKVHNPSALPWQRNDFSGAFELKSANGAFGFRMEVRRQR